MNKISILSVALALLITPHVRAQSVEINKFEFDTTAATQEEYKAKIIHPHGPQVPVTEFKGEANLIINRGKKSEETEPLKLEINQIGDANLSIKQISEDEEEPIQEFPMKIMTFNKWYKDEPAGMSLLDVKRDYSLGMAEGKVTVVNSTSSKSLDLLSFLEKYIHTHIVNKYVKAWGALNTKEAKSPFYEIPYELKLHTLHSFISEHAMEDAVGSLEMLEDMHKQKYNEKVYFEVQQYTNTLENGNKAKEAKIAIYFYNTDYPNILTNYDIYLDEAAWNEMIKQLE